MKKLSATDAACSHPEVADMEAKEESNKAEELDKAEKLSKSEEVA